MDQQPIIVDAREVLRLGRFRKIWLLGWAVATLAISFAAVQTLRIRERDLVVQDLRVVQAEQREIQQQQQQVTASFIKAWEQQKQTTDLIVTWGQFVVDRTTMANQNNKNPPISFVKRQ